MKIAGWNTAEVFGLKYPQGHPRLANWRKPVQNVAWKKPVGVIKTFNMASKTPSKVFGYLTLAQIG